MANPSVKERLDIDNSKGNGKVAYLDDDLIYVPKVPADADVTALASATTLDADDFMVNLTNTGSTGTLEHQLPAASTVKGEVLHFQLTAAEIVRLQPPSGGGVYLGGSGVADKYVQVAGVIGNYIDLYSDGSTYHVVGYAGVVTKES